MKSNIPIVYTKNANNPEAMTPRLPMGGIWSDPCNITGKVCHKALTKLKIPCAEQQRSLLSATMQQQTVGTAGNRSCICLPEQRPYCEVASGLLQPACTLQQLQLRLCFTENIYQYVLHTHYLPLAFCIDHQYRWRLAATDIIWLLYTDLTAKHVPRLMTAHLS